MSLTTKLVIEEFSSQFRTHFGSQLRIHRFHQTTEWPMQHNDDGFPPCDVLPQLCTAASVPQHTTGLLTKWRRHIEFWGGDSVI
eukprot:6492729-Amphidinium_carterae.1